MVEGDDVCTEYDAGGDEDKDDEEDSEEIDADVDIVVGVKAVSSSSIPEIV